MSITNCAGDFVHLTILIFGIPCSFHVDAHPCTSSCPSTWADIAFFMGMTMPINTLSDGHVHAHVSITSCIRQIHVDAHLLRSAWIHQHAQRRACDGFWIYTPFAQVIGMDGGNVTAEERCNPPVHKYQQT